MEVREFPTIRFAAAHHRGPYHEIGPKFEEVSKKMGEAGFLGPETIVAGLYYNDPEQTPPEELESDACISMPDHKIIPMGLQEVELAGGRYFVHRYVGEFSGLPAAWGEAYQQFHAAGYTEGGGPPAEIYVSDMATTPMSEYITEIIIPIAPESV